MIDEYMSKQGEEWKVTDLPTVNSLHATWEIINVDSYF